MEKASGVYLKITDNSIVPAIGASALSLVIPMVTLKGEVGLNLVNAGNFKDVLGYDLKYNSNYYGLSQILSWVNQAYVWRINQEAAIANAYWAGGTKQSLEGADNPISLETLDGVKLAVGCKNLGNWGNKAIRFKAAIKKGNYAVEVDDEGKYVLEQEKVSKIAEPITFNVNGVDIDFFGGFVVYDDSGTSIIGVLKETTSGHYDVYRVSAGIVAINVAAGEPEYVAVAPSAEFNVTETYYTESGGTYTEETGLTEFAAGTTYYVQRPTYTYSGAIGEAEIDDNDVLSMKLDRPFNSASYWTSEFIGSEYLDWVLEYADYEDNVASNVQKFEFSIDPKADNYYSKVDLGDLFLINNGGLLISNAELLTWATLDNGDNGRDAVSIDATELDMTVISESLDANVLLFNGLNESVSVVNAIATTCAARKIHAFVDEPLLNYRDAEAWRKKIVGSEYVAVAGRADKIETSEGYIYVYPSVKYAYIYSQMLENQGNLYYPPAGYTTGVIPITELEALDYENYGDNLKTNRINYMIVTSMGAAMWEQRTTYPLNSDLSYICSVFILDDLASQIVIFERQFNFRFINPGNMTLQQMGLETILNGFQSAGYIYSYEMVMPTDNKSREYTIQIGVRLAKDAEVINIEILLRP